jgi:hypothetical protein
MIGIGLGREPDLVEDGIHELAGRVSRERPACTVRAMSARRQSEDENSGLRIAEARHGTRPVVVIHIGTAFLATDLLPVGHQPWTLCTDNDFVVKNFKRRRHLEEL